MYERKFNFYIDSVILIHQTQKKYEGNTSCKNIYKRRQKKNKMN